MKRKKSASWEGEGGRAPVTQNESRCEVAKESAAAVEAACQSVGVSFGTSPLGLSAA